MTIENRFLSLYATQPKLLYSITNYGWPSPYTHAALTYHTISQDAKNFLVELSAEEGQSLKDKILSGKLFAYPYKGLINAPSCCGALIMDMQGYAKPERVMNGLSEYDKKKMAVIVLRYEDYEKSCDYYESEGYILTLEIYGLVVLFRDTTVSEFYDYDNAKKLKKEKGWVVERRSNGEKEDKEVIKKDYTVQLGSFKTRSFCFYNSLSALSNHPMSFASHDAPLDFLISADRQSGYQRKKYGSLLREIGFEPLERPCRNSNYPKYSHWLTVWWRENPNYVVDK